MLCSFVACVSLCIYILSLIYNVCAICRRGRGGYAPRGGRGGRGAPYGRGGRGGGFRGGFVGRGRGYHNSYY